MKRVMCIADGGRWQFVKPFTILFFFKIKINSAGPDYGEVCTVTGQYTSDGELYYYLSEYPHKPKAGYYAKWFIPLSDINEEEILLKRIIKEQTN